MFHITGDLPQGNRFKIIFTTEYTEDTEFRFF